MAPAAHPPRLAEGVSSAPSSSGGGSDNNGGGSDNGSGSSKGSGSVGGVAKTLPATGGILPIAGLLGALLVGSGLLVRRIAR